MFILGITTYIIEPDGVVKFWTTDPNGVKSPSGDDLTFPPYIAQEFAALKGALTIAGAEGASYAVMPDGRVLAWGSNWNGLLGNTTLAELEVRSEPHPPVPMPVATQPVPKVMDVAAQGRHVLALTAEGTVYAWGNGQVGQLGIGEMPIINFKAHLPGPMAYVPFPIRVPGLTGVSAIAAGSAHSLALLKDGSLMAWGENQYGQLGDGTSTNRTKPVAVSGITNATAVDAGSEYSMALLADGTVMTWGYGSAALGRPKIETRSVNSTPTPVPGVTGITAIAAGGAHALALRQDGGIISWGHENVYRPVGHRTEPPGPVPLITTARAILAGSLSSAAVLRDGTIMVWGALPSLFYRLDLGSQDASIYPVPMVVKGL
jgi:alpha-tubulin suppressor-like RCC1 family protein